MRTEQPASDAASLRASLRRWRFVCALLGAGLVAGAGMAMMQHEEPTVVGFAVSDQASGRFDDTFYRLLSDGVIEELNTTRPEPEWQPVQGLGQRRR